jgi:hypothetical protein
MSTAESLLSPDLIKLYGRPIAELQLNIPGGAGGAANVQNLGANQFLRAQLNAANAQLARIYGFSFEGHYYDLAKPVIMLVHGPGEPVTWPPAVGAPPPRRPRRRRPSIRPARLRATGTSRLIWCTGSTRRPTSPCVWT